MGIFKGARNIFEKFVEVGFKGVREIAKGTDKLLGGQGSSRFGDAKTYQDILGKNKASDTLSNIGGGAVLGLAAAGVGKGASSRAAAGKFGQAAAGILGTTAALSLAGSKKVVDAAANLPKSTEKLAGDIADKIEGGNKNITDKTLLGLGGVIAGTGLGIAGSNLLQNLKDKDMPQEVFIGEQQPLTDFSTGNAGVITAGSPMPVTPQTESIEKPKTKRKRRTTKKKPTININNRVNVNVKTSARGNTYNRKIYKY